MQYLTWELETKLRHIAGILRDKLDQDAYQQYGARAFSLMLFKRLSDLLEEALAQQAQSFPCTHGVLVPVSAQWSTLLAAPSPSIALEAAACRMREVNAAGSPGESLADTISTLGTLQTDVTGTDRHMRCIIKLIDSIELGDRRLKYQEVVPGHHMYDAYQHLITPIYEATGILMEHVKILAPSRGRPLWRYMCLCRFRDLIKSEELYFRRADKLPDRFEGVPPGLDQIVGPVGLYREFTFMNCWFQGNVESNLMWTSYGTEHKEQGPEHDNLAIRTSHEMLQDKIKGLNPVYVGRVKYFNYDAPFPSAGWRPLWDIELGTLSLYFMKRREFSSESEVRAVIQFPIPDCIDPQPPSPDGVRVPVDLSGFINGVIVNPQADETFIASIESTLRTKNLDIPIEKSELARAPTISQIRPTPITFSTGHH